MAVLLVVGGLKSGFPSGLRIYSGINIQIGQLKDRKNPELNTLVEIKSSYIISARIKEFSL
jgi:hypothetical protein